MRTPEEFTVTDEHLGVVSAESIATEVIEKLDEKFCRYDVDKIVIWITYLSHQN